ncbi:SemiSWEET family sugar transporter [Falsiroseomonas sp. CW058]|uniref:SemiSWEET family sugar transporter n=1 Tax=Falsiroseomonas sp. CW058 TaxID=3388664 RepID=UPI003D310AA7
MELIGLAAGLLTTSAFVPQALRTWRTGSARDFSLGLLVLLVAGNSLWMAYGALKGSAGLVAANLVTVPLTVYLLSVKLRRG